MKNKGSLQQTRGCYFFEAFKFKGFNILYKGVGKKGFILEENILQLGLQ